ncbi:Uma2 family endonuclease [Dactylococcopsis salina]|uniref:Putative restriction endonuclease domain-containing protein n=1 Tax=Dactylococcopsis salina (strain PCC 8305) TaxID=13035 RepID=K9YPS7_DACS8|nr:Uma2 family endonuclease [Dactylococcopsis salina]AFZ48879.1 hypothetical protein Dacsa_0059 [Dactylococcopsis salina PCC 8305]
MITISPRSIGEHYTLLQGVKWQTYQLLALDLAETSNQHLTYDRGILEIMTPLPEHERNKRLLGRIVETTTEILGLEVYSLGSTTWSRKDLQRGIEPDECYYITEEATVRGKVNFDLTVDPPPDLAIEIDITSSSLDRLSIYAALGIREVWRFNGKELYIYVLENGSYQDCEQSQVLSVLNKNEIIKILNQRDTMGENALLKQLREWLQNQE